MVRGTEDALAPMKNKTINKIIFFKKSMEYI